MVVGQNFGPLGAVDIVVQYGSDGRTFVASNCSALAPSSTSAGGATQQAVCQSAPGVGKNLLWTLTSRGQTSAPFALTPDTQGVSASRYTTPAITQVAPAVSPLSTRGKQAVLLRGLNFGPSGLAGLVVTYGPLGEQGRRYTARNCSVDVAAPHVAVVCTTISGVGANHVWRVTVGGQESAPSQDVTSYVAPTVVSVTGPGTFQAKTNGGQSVTISGQELGAAADTAGRILVTYGPWPYVGKYTAASCAVDLDFSSIQCLTTEGTGSGHSWVVNVDGNPSAVFAANTSYGAPVVATYSGEGTVRGTSSCVDGGNCGSTRGHQVINITGQNFGPVGGVVPEVKYGATGGELVAESCTVTVAHTLITCLTVPAAGARLKWSVSIGEWDRGLPSWFPSATVTSTWSH